MARLYFITLLFCSVIVQSSPAQVRQAEQHLYQANELIFEAPDSSRLLARKAIVLAEETQNDTLAARGYHLLGLAEAIQGNYSLSQEYSLKALTIFEKYSLLKRQSATISNVAGIIIAQERYREAITYLKRALALDEQLQDGPGVASDYNNLGVAYRRLELLDSALYYYNKVLQKAAALKPEENKEFSAKANYNIAFIYTLQGRYDEAGTLLDEANAYYRKMNDRYSLCYGAWYEAMLAYKTGDFATAITLAEKATGEANRLHLDEVLLNLFEILSDAHAALHHYDLALQYQQQHETVSDSMYTHEKARIVAELQYVYETEKKDQEILVLKKEEQRQRFVVLVTGIAALAAFFLLIVIYLSKRLQTIRHREREAHLTAEREKARHEKYQLQVEKELQEERSKQLQVALEGSQRELATTTLFIQQKNNLLEGLQEEIHSLTLQTDEQQQRQLLEMSKNLQHHMNFEDDWSKVIMHFEKVHPQFFNKLKEICPDLTMNELRQAAYIRINLTNKEVARLMNVDNASVKMSRYRIKKKLKLTPEESLTKFILSVG